MLIRRGTNTPQKAKRAWPQQAHQLNTFKDFFLYYNFYNKMNALQVMHPRRPENAIDWTKIENENFRLPPVFKIFHNTFNVETILEKNWYSYFSNEYKKLSMFGFYDHYKIPYLILDAIFRVEDLEALLPKYLDIKDEIEREIYDQQVIPIAYCPTQELIVLGVGRHNEDKIYYYRRYEEEKLRLVSENIFEFFRDYYVKIDAFYLHGTPLSSLYRNWNEDFWRIRAEGDPITID